MGEETSRLEKEKVLVEFETGKMPQILVGTANKQVERLDEEPKLSVISPSMNLGRFLEDTIWSVANQTFRGFEHIVIDGDSTDDTLAILKRYPHIKWISEKDSGYLEALRKGLALARGKYVMQCAVSDGYINSGWFQRCVDVLDADPEVSLVWGFPQYLTEDGKLGDISYPQFHHALPPQKYDFFVYWLRTCFWLPEGNFCVRKEVLDKCFPPFPGSPRDLEPWLEFNYNFNSLGYLPYHVPVVANFGRTHENQLGQRERERRVGQRKLEGYLKKVRRYRWKLMTGMATHVYRDGAHTILPMNFSVKRFRRAYLGFMANCAVALAREHLSFTFLIRVKRRICRMVRYCVRDREV